MSYLAAHTKSGLVWSFTIDVSLSASNGFPDFPTTVHTRFCTSTDWALKLWKFDLIKEKIPATEFLFWVWRRMHESIYGVQGRNCCCCANHILSKWCNISLIIRTHMAPKRNCMHAPHAASTLRIHGIHGKKMQCSKLDMQIAALVSIVACYVCIASMCRSRVLTKTCKNLLYAANCMIASVVLSLTWLQIRIPKVYVNKTFSIKLCNLFYVTVCWRCWISSWGPASSSDHEPPEFVTSIGELSISGASNSIIEQNSKGFVKGFFLLRRDTLYLNLKPVLERVECKTGFIMWVLLRCYPVMVVCGKV
jgi:hypothetical protein